MPIKVTRVTSFGILYTLGLVVFAILGAFLYADYRVDLEHQVTQSDRFSSDLAYVDLPTISVDVASSRGSGTVRIDLTLEVDKKYARQLETYKPRITARLSAYTRQINIEQLKRPRATVWLRPELLHEVNSASSPVPVMDVIFKRMVVL